jgi:hypothetical protein
MTGYLTDLPRLFRRAADHIEQFGHSQGWFCSPGLGIGDQPVDERPTCLVGAIAWAHTGSPVMRTDDEVCAEAIHFVSDHLPGTPPIFRKTGQPDYLNHIAHWNDATDRTPADAVELLRTLAPAAAYQAEAELLCRYITEHDDHEPFFWDAKEQDRYRKELAELHRTVAA